MGNSSIDYVYLRDADGYNNLVYVLNEACKKLYSCASYGATARSVKIEDILDVSSFDPTTYTNEYGYKYGDTLTITDKAYYPNIFPHEKGQRVGTEPEGTELGVSDQSSVYYGYSGGTANSSITVKQTDFKLSLSVAPDTYRDLLWAAWGYAVASRGVDIRGSYAIFGGFRVIQGSLSCNILRTTRGTGMTYGFSVLRPIVSIPIQNVRFAETGSGSEGAPWSLKAR